MIAPDSTSGPSMKALHLRDYFWLHNGPGRGEQKLWRRIECAGIRLTETVGSMRASHPEATRLWAARRVRRAARECRKLIPQLRHVDAWTLDVAAELEALADEVLNELARAPEAERPN